jgi:hypothetical protein
VVGQKWPPNASSGAPDDFARCLLSVYFLDLFLGGHFSNTLRILVDLDKTELNHIFEMLDDWNDILKDAVSPGEPSP